MTAEVLIILLSILLSAYFSGMEIAFITANQMHIELERKRNNFASRCLTYMADRPKNFIATMLIGNNIALVVYGYFMGKLLTPFIINLLGDISSGFVLLLQTLVSTLIILITAEFLPKSIFSVYANKIFKFLAIPTYFIFQFFSVITFGVVALSNFFLRLFGLPTDSEEQIPIKDELKYYISEQLEDPNNEEIETEIQIFHNALEFSDIKVRECLIPRKEIIALEVESSLQEVRQQFINTGLSKLIVFRNDIDHIIGYIHSFDLFKNPKTLKHMLLPVEFVHETSTAREVMNRLIRKRKSVAIVLDEYGGTSGMLTIEDIIEELFGEIEDEHDKVRYLEEQITDKEYLFSARLEIDYLNENYNLDLPENDSYETLGGLLVHLHEDIPEMGQKITADDFEFVAEKVSKTNIEEIRLKIKS